MHVSGVSWLEHGGVFHYLLETDRELYDILVEYLVKANEYLPH